MSKKQQKKTDSDTFFGGVMLGVIAGSIIALWYAPQSGEKTVESIMRRFKLRNSDLNVPVIPEKTVESIMRRFKLPTDRHLTEKNQ